MKRLMNGFLVAVGVAVLLKATTEVVIECSWWCFPF